MGERKGDEVSKIYKCDICGTPYEPSSFKRDTNYAELGVKDFNGHVSNEKLWDVCPECYRSILEFIDSISKKE